MDLKTHVGISMPPGGGYIIKAMLIRSLKISLANGASHTFIHTHPPRCSGGTSIAAPPHRRQRQGGLRATLTFWRGPASALIHNYHSVVSNFAIKDGAPTP